MRYTPQFILKTSLAVIMCGFVAGYIMFQAQNVWNGPIIIVETPPDGASRQEFAKIAGVAHNVAFITLNGRRIYTDKDGNFAERLLLSEGYNVAEVAAKDKFGRNVEKTIEIVYKEEERGYSLTINNESYGKAN